MRWVVPLLAVSLSVLAAEPAGKKASPVDLVSGALSLVATQSCGGSLDPPEAAIEWPAFNFDRKPPKGKGNHWGPKRLLGCHVGTWTLTEAIGAGALWAQKGPAAIEADPLATMRNPEQTHPAFKTEFGWEMPHHGKLEKNVLPAYDARKIEALFNRLYLKPAEPLGSTSAQALYDLLLKPKVARFVREAVVLKQKVPRAKLGKLAKEYQAAAKEKGETFDGPSWLGELATAQLGQQDNGRTLGTMLRRTADGTWPTVVKLLKKMMKDYDPQLAKEVATSL